MSTRIVLPYCLLITVLLITGLAWAQQPKRVPRVVMLGGSADANKPTINFNLFRQGLRDLGYVEGKNILVEQRSAEAKTERFPSLVAELVQLNVDVLVSTSLVAVRAAKQATKTIPI